MKKNKSTIILILVFFVGLSVMLYPTLSDYVNQRHQSRAVATYAEDVDKLTDADTIVSKKAFAGPYTLTAFKINESAAYAKNDSYKGLTPAKNSAVQVKYFADASNLKMAVQQGQIDVAYRSLSPTDIEDLSKDSKVKVVKGPGGEERFIAFNFKIQPYGESQPDADANKAKAVRQAVANLIDREELSTKVYKGTYTPMYSFIPDGLAGHDDTLKSAYGDGNGKPSTEKAKKVLADAGVTTPVDLKLQYNNDHYGSVSADEYAALKSQLEAGGLFKVDMQSTEWTQYNKDRVVTDDSDGVYPVYQLGWFPDYSDPDNYLSPFFRDGNFVNNGYSNKEVNDLIVKQAGEKDESARGDILKQIQKLETEDLSTIPLLQGAQVAVTGTSVKGVTLDASFRFRYASVTKGLFEGGGAVCRRQTEGSPTRMTPLSRLRRQLPSERGAFIALYTDYQHQGASRVRQRHSDLQHHSGESQDEEEPTVR